ncbi:MAG: hypothetical protein LBE09_09135 [Christensenellaceae bacterium]|jgi:hypothetical protein|nr:hypothetical protein [Christensenellaceae bacterium]
MKTLTKKKYLFIIALIVVLIIAGIIVIRALVFGEDDTKLDPQYSIQEYLDAFGSAMLNINATNRRMDKRIELLLQDEEVSTFHQICEYIKTDEIEIAHMAIEENYYTLGTYEFDCFDEYYFIDDIMYMHRKTVSETVETSFASDIDVFWTVADENIGHGDYDLDESNFENISIKHTADEHILTVKVARDKLKVFFKEEEDIENITDVTFSIQTDINYVLKGYQLHYSNLDFESETESQQARIVTNIIVKCDQIEIIEIAEWVSQAPMSQL